MDDVKNEISRQLQEQRSIAQETQETEKPAAQSAAQANDPLEALVKHFAPADFDIETEKKWVVDGQYRPAQAGGQPVQSAKPGLETWEAMTPEQLGQLSAEQIDKIIHDASKPKGNNI